MADGVLPKRIPWDTKPPHPRINWSKLGGSSKNCRVLIPEGRRGFRDIVRNEFFPFGAGGAGGTGKFGRELVQTNTGAGTDVSTAVLDTTEGGLLFVFKRPNNDDNHYLFDSEGDRHLLFFLQNQGLQYFANTSLLININQAAIAAAIPEEKYSTLVIRWPSSELWSNGVLVTTGSTGTPSTIGSNYIIGSRFNDIEGFDSNISLFCILNPVQARNAQNLSRDPWQIFQPRLHLISTGVAAVGIITPPPPTIINRAVARAANF